MKSSYLKIHALSLIPALLLAGCRGQENLSSVNEISHGVTETVVSISDPEREGMVGLVFQNGVECLGEEAQPVESETIYVSPTGDDNNSGISPKVPLGTLAKALCNLDPGQTLFVLPGIYHESVILGAFGNSTSPITIHGVIENDQRPILDGESIRSMGIALVESTNFVIQNLEFRNYTDEGLYILSSSDMVIRNNRFIDNGRASTDPDFEGEGFGLAIIGVKNALIEGNQVIGNGPNRERWLNYTLGMGIDTYELFDSVIRNNYIADTTGGGILVEDGTNVLVENNTIENNELDANGDYWDGGIWVDGSKHITLRGNTITNNHGPGLNLSDEDVQYPQSSIGFVVEGNIVTDNVFGVYMWNFGICPPPEEAISFGENQIENNTEQDVWCEEWTCGEGEACE